MDFLLIYAAEEFVDFREAEFIALLDLSCVQFDRNQLSVHDWTDNFLLVQLHSTDDCKRLIKRSVLIKCAYEIWTSSGTLDELCLNIATIDDHYIHRIITHQLSIRLNVESVHKRLKLDEKVQLIERIFSSHKQLVGAHLNLSNPDVELGLLLDYPYDWTKGRVIASAPSAVFYGQLVGYTDRCDVLGKYKLSQRLFIGNTSMDVQLSFLMVNLGRVMSHHIVLDPFVGTGSILVAAGHYEAKVFGVDIDYNVIHGLGKSTRANEIWRSEGECLRLNFQQYGILSSFGDVFVGDTSRLDKILRDSFRFDVILTDPPYGVREKCLKIMSKEYRPYMYDHQVQHYPQKENYNITSVFDDLLKFAAKRLQLGGFIVMWLPVIRERYSGTNCLPSHSVLKLISNCEQVMNNKTSRRLLVYQKISQNDISDVDISSNVVLDNSFRNLHLYEK